MMARSAFESPTPTPSQLQNMADMHAGVVLTRGKWAYISVAVLWSITLFGAMVFLWYHRRLPQLQIRRLPLVFVAMISLHIYWVIVLIAYVLGPVYPCFVEYWVMSVLLPFGIAVFQIANTQFLWIAIQQRRYMSTTSLDDLKMSKKTSVLDGHSGSFLQRMTIRLKNLDSITRMVIYIGIAMGLQVLLTIIIFLISRKFHSNFGLVPADLFVTDVEERNKCIRGWEWWPSMVWQFFWAWIYAPSILWASRCIQDTRGWRLQTILCCVAGLPCSPLWLAGLYSPRFATINNVFIPPMWFAVSIFCIQAFTVLIPCYQVYRHHHLRSETLAAIAEWESKTKETAHDSIESASTMINPSGDAQCRPSAEAKKGLIEDDVVQSDELNEHINKVRNTKDSSKKSTPKKEHEDDADTISSRRANMYTMDALEDVLHSDADPLQMFAALRDFSGENISFLTHLITWKKILASRQREASTPEFSDELDQQRVDEVRMRDQFNRAINLYTTFVSTKHAMFPISIAPSTRQKLDTIFAGPTESLFSESAAQQSEGLANDSDVERRQSLLQPQHPEARRSASDTGSVLNLDTVWYWDDIPKEYSPRCFNDAEREVKYMVLTDTWPKYLNAGHAEEAREAEGDLIARRLSHFFSPHREDKL